VGAFAVEQALCQTAELAAASALAPWNPVPQARSPGFVSRPPVPEGGGQATLSQLAAAGGGAAAGASRLATSVRMS
jgi:hypothetical protein